MADGSANLPVWQRCHLDGTVPLPGHFAITLDDGPLATTTPAMVAVLNRFGVRATFFVVGRRVVRSPELVRQVVAAGHALGCHGFDHVDASTMAATDLRDQLDRNQRAVNEALGRVYPLRQFRPPYGVVTDDLRTIVRERAGEIVLWHYDSSDRQAPRLTADELLPRLAASPTSAVWSGILLAHDTYPQSPAVVEAFVRQALARGLRAVTTAEMVDAVQGRRDQG